MRLFWRIRVAMKRVIIRVGRGPMLIEFCRECGRQQPVVWHVSDDLWAAVTGRTDGSGVLCVECFDRAAWRTVGLIRWTARVDDA